MLRKKKKKRSESVSSKPLFGSEELLSQLHGKPIRGDLYDRLTTSSSEKSLSSGFDSGRQPLAGARAA